MNLSALRARGGARLAVAATIAAAVALAWNARGDAQPAASANVAAPAARPALTVTVVAPRTLELPRRIAANGNVAAWQEASIGAESGGLRLAEVRVNVGDVVRRGQVLAVFAPETIEADLAQARASLAEAQAALADARANAERVRQVQTSGALSQQQVTQLLTAEKTAEARAAALEAQVRAQELRLRQTRVVVPDDGTIAARAATVGAVVPQGQELFRLIRGNRLEWRAEVTAAEIAALRPGQRATVTSATGASLEGRVRAVAPTVDAQTRNGLVYVDLPPSAMRDGAFKAGMFARGEFVVGGSPGTTVPLQSVSLRDGFSYLFAVGPDNRVAQLKVQLGRRAGDRVEIVSGLEGDERIVASGAAFLADGDTVKVVAQ